jgi:hypothetical protein
MDLDAEQEAELYPARGWTLLERALFAIGIKSLWIDAVEAGGPVDAMPPEVSHSTPDFDQSSTR